MATFIVSWKADNAELRNKRTKMHHDQLRWFLEKSDRDIYIDTINSNLERDYTPEFLNNSRIHISNHFAKTMHLNQVKHHFQHPKGLTLPDKYNIFADDDSWLYDKDFDHHCDGDHFVRTLEQNENLFFPYIDIFQPLQPKDSPYLHKYDPKLYSNAFVFKPVRVIKGSLLFIKNDKKIVNWQDGLEWFPGTDIMFCFLNLLAGNKVYQLNNIGLKEAGQNLSTWCSNEERRKGMNKGFQNLKKLLVSKGYDVTDADVADRFKRFVPTRYSKVTLTKPGKKVSGFF